MMASISGESGGSDTAPENSGGGTREASLPLAYNECQEAVKRLTDFLSHELGPDEEVRVREHLHVCRGCFAKFHFEEALLRTIRERVQTIQAPADLRARILALIVPPAPPGNENE